MSENGNMPAYPYIFNGHVEGLTKREVMAKDAMAGLLANGELVQTETSKAGGKSLVAAYVAAATTYADALLAELERTKKP